MRIHFKKNDHNNLFQNDLGQRKSDALTNQINPFNFSIFEAEKVN